MEEEQGHIWAVQTQASLADQVKYLSLLSSHERERWRSMHRMQTRTTFLTTRGALRCLLGRYLNRPPEDLQFRYGARGKPHLANDGMRTIHFNVSHSQGLAVIAISRSSALGVDVEKYRSNLQFTGIARRFFSATENRALETLPEAKRIKAFFDCWTCKEAYTKATGLGLATPLDQISVSLRHDTSPQLIATPEGSGLKGEWQLRALYPTPKYASALVSGKGLHTCTHWQWDARYAPIISPTNRRFRHHGSSIQLSS